MNNLMEYKGYIGSVEFSEADGLFYGKVQGIRSLISYEGTNASELIADFHGAVDDYLTLCEEEGIKPEIAYKGSLNVRFRHPDTHRRAAIYAIAHDQSLNSFIEEWLFHQQELKDELITKEEYFEWKIGWPYTCDECRKREPIKKWRRGNS